MLDVKDAVKISFPAISELFGDVKDVRLEEAQLSEDERYWLVTFSFIDPSRDVGGGLQTLLGTGREYKVVRISSEDGRLLGISIRKP